MIAYHFTGDKLRDGRPIPPVGEWLVHNGKVVMCHSGLHASKHPFDALMYALGPRLHRVKLEGNIRRGDDKVVGRRRKILASIDATDLLRAFSRWCALRVIDKWDAPKIVREYLATGDESIRDAAESAARAAAWAAAWDATRDARAAAWDATRDAKYAAMDALAAANAARDAAMDSASASAMDAARADQRAKFKKMVEEAFAQQEALR